MSKTDFIIKSVISILLLSLSSCYQIDENSNLDTFFEAPTNYELKLMLENGNYYSANTPETCREINNWNLINVTNLDYLLIMI